MTSAEYRAKAQQLLTSKSHEYLEPRIVEQAAVWAQLATAAAIEEQGAARGDADRPASVQIAEAAVRAAAIEERGQAVRDGE